MISEKDKLIKLVAKLIQLTQDEKIKWNLKEPRPSLRKDNNFAGMMFTAEYEGKYLGIYRTKEKVYRNFGLKDFLQPINVAGTQGFQGFGRDVEWEWASVTVLEIIDYAGECIWSFPQISGLDDLYAAVQYHVSGIKDLIDSVLGEEKEKD